MPLKYIKDNAVITLQNATGRGSCITYAGNLKTLGGGDLKVAYVGTELMLRDQALFEKYLWNNG